MLAVEQAVERILAAFAPLAPETVALPAVLGRVLARDVVARVSQPPVAVSAMDGWAVRGADIAMLPTSLTPIGAAPAGHPFGGTVGIGQTVRIFTGAAVPNGADTVVLQEDCDDQPDGTIRVREGRPGQHVRKAGLDFHQGQTGLQAGRRLGVRDIALAAAMNVPWLAVHRQPRVAILATGDEIVRPGEPLAPGQIVSSNSLALAALVQRCGGVAIDLGIAPDQPDALIDRVAGAAGCDVLVTSGGASVGQHDLIRSALGAQGMQLDFWKIAMRPGKPLMFGRLNGMPLLGLPGNPVASLVCGLLFLAPALRRLSGVADPLPVLDQAVLGQDLPANDRRQDYLRARRLADGTVAPFAIQDSSMLSPLAQADCLIVRPPLAPAASKGQTVPILSLDGY